jgi:hypothetical protein
MPPDERRIRWTAIVGGLAVVAAAAIAFTLATRRQPTERNAVAGATTTSTTVSTTTSTVLASGPVPSAPSCNPGTGSSGSGVKPSLVFFGCATSADYLSDLRWDTWTRTEATGTATRNRNDCIAGGPNAPSCADGDYKHYPVNVTLGDPGPVEGVYVFRTITLTRRFAEESDDATALFCGHGKTQDHCDAPGDSWGYVTG